MARRRQRVVAGSDLRYELTITLAEAVTGVTREIRFPTLVQCATCAGSGAEPGSEPERCPECNGTGERRRVSQTILGQMVNITACPRCNGEGRIVSTPCHACKGDGRLREDRRLQVAVPAGIEPASGSRSRVRARPVRGAGRPATSTWWSPFARIRISSGAGPSCTPRMPVTFAQAALGAKVAVRTVDGPEEVDVPAGTQSGQEIRLRGRGMPRLRGAGGATSTSWSRSSSRPS